MPNGKTGLPVGRPKGSRQALAESFILSLQDAWKEKKTEIIQEVIATNPVKFMEMISKLVPRQVHAEVVIDGEITHNHVHVSEVDALLAGLPEGGETRVLEDVDEDGSILPDPVRIRQRRHST